ncbi:MAG TPA: M1 family metallopeptidase [Herpetosiphonaceae bacterium]
MNLCKPTLRCLALWIFLLLPLGVAASPQTRPIVMEPLPQSVEYAAAMRPAFAADVKRPDLPHYDLDLTVDPRARRLTGHMHLTFRNTTGGVLKDVVLRLYPQFPRDIFGDGGTIKMDVSNIVVQNIATTGTYQAQRTALRLSLPVPVPANEMIALSLDYSANIEPWQRSEGTFPLPSYYPMLAIWEGGWRTDVTRFPDRVYAASGLYHARITVPSGWTAISTGSTIGSQANDNGTTTFEAVSGPVREFAFSVGRFASARASHDGIEVVVHHRADDGLDAAADVMAKHVAASLATFNNLFGPYPYRALEFHLINARRGFDIGAEYPGLVVILLNGRYTQETRFVTAHEVGHQWFYGMIGNDIYHEPWLDEAFAQYSGILVEEQWAGKAAAARMYDQQVTRLSRRAKLPAGLGIGDYGSWNGYYASVYGRGAQFLAVLRGEIGDAAFFAGMRRYVSGHKYGIAHSDDVKEAFEQSSGRDLDALFKRWVGR